MNTAFRVMFTGGGTGGHIFPIIPVVRALKEKFRTQGSNNLELFFVGSGDFNTDFLANEGVIVKHILAGKLNRFFSFKTILGFFKIPIGIFQSLWHLFFIMPDVVFSKGAYGSVPVVFSAWLYAIPVILHESDSVPGLANRICSFFARRIAISFPESAQFFSSKKVFISGNPVRKELLQGSRDEAIKLFSIQTQKPVIFIFGSSQGATALNEVILGSLQKLLENYEVIHQCGTNHFEAIMSVVGDFYKNSGIPQNYHPLAFLDEQKLKNAYAISDLIISRAGANNIAEIAYLGKPSILVPLPNSAGGHQAKNAFSFAKNGGAIVLEQANLQTNILLAQIDKIFSDKLLMLKMANSALDFATPNAGEKLANEIIAIAK